MTTRLAACGLLLASLLCSTLHAAEEDSLGTHGHLQSGDIKLHYVTAGEGPLVVLIHGFPDYWYSWREQIPALAENFQVVALDMRGYNLSDQPEGVENYTMDKLVGDVAATLEHFGREKAVIVGHDWGGMVAWSFAMQHPDKTERLVILNLPHPKGLMRELANNPEQQQASEYARNFQKPDAAKRMIPGMLAFWVKDPEARKKYIEAFNRSSVEGMLNYYKANYPREPYEDTSADLPQVTCPVLMFHGLGDTALLPGALNDTWNWIDGPLTLITIPGAGHFVQQDAADLVTQRLVNWLKLELPAESEQ